MGNEFDALREECERQRSMADKTHRLLATKLILRDLRDYVKNSGHEAEPGTGELLYILDKKVYVIVANANIEIRDERGALYVWMFEVAFKGCTHTDLVMCKEVPVQIHAGSIVYDDTYTPEITEVTRKLEHSVRYLTSTAPEDLEYIYRNAYANEDIGSLEQVMQKVWAREPSLIDERFKIERISDEDRRNGFDPKKMVYIG